MPANLVSTQTANITSSQTVYNPTSSGVQTTVTGCLVANTTGAPLTATVTLTNATATVTTNIVKNVSIPSGTALDIMNSAKINMVQNQVLAVSATGAVDVTVSSVELT